MKKAEKLQELLSKIKTQGLGDAPDFPFVDVSAPTFIKGGRLYVSSEESNSSYWLDYYGEFRGGYAWINEKLEAFAKEQGCHWQWINPACIGLYEA